jgi:DNA-3-methyladenine glycosylase
MFGPPGIAYVYFTYGMHWMLNVVTEADGFPAAVLIRAIMPTEGEAVMRRRRAASAKGHRAALMPTLPLARLAAGPAMLAQALAIDKRFNGHDLCTPRAALFIERAAPVPEAAVVNAPRIGLNHSPEPWKSVAWNWKTVPQPG